MKSNYEVLKLFPVPLIKFKFKYHKNYEFKTVDRSVRKPENWELPLNTSFPNIQKNDDFIDDIVKNNLLKDLKFCIDEVFDELDLPKSYSFKNFWYNIYHNNQGQELHDHLPLIDGNGTYWSGVYYAMNSTPTTFIRPDKIFKTQLFPNHVNCKLKDSFFETFIPDVDDGDIILFPPYLSHQINYFTNDENNMRLTFAFNLQYKQQND